MVAKPEEFFTFQVDQQDNEVGNESSSTDAGFNLRKNIEQTIDTALKDCCQYYSENSENTVVNPLQEGEFLKVQKVENVAEQCKALGENEVKTDSTVNAKEQFFHLDNKEEKDLPNQTTDQTTLFKGYVNLVPLVETQGPSAADHKPEDQVCKDIS